MSERETRRFFQSLEGEEQSPEIFETEMKAWNDAVFISDYLHMFRNGLLLSTTIYGNPYPINEQKLEHSEYTDKLSALHQQLVSEDIEMVVIDKPKLQEMFPGPVSREENQSRMFASSYADDLRERYFSKFFERMYSSGYRDVLTIGTQGYLDEVPDQLLLFSYCAPDGTKSFISQDGYVAVGLGLTPDFERPISQRGAIKQGFLNSTREHDLFESLTSQVAYLVDNQHNFSFDDSDLLGYRPNDMTEAGIAEAWALIN